jgi:hypothetical protein
MRDTSFVSQMYRGSSKPEQKQRQRQKQRKDNGNSKDNRNCKGVRTVAIVHVVMKSSSSTSRGMASTRIVAVWSWWSPAICRSSPRPIR